MSACYRRWGALLGWLLALAVLAGCNPDGSLRLPYDQSRKLKYEPVVVAAASRLTVGPGALALRLEPTEGPLGSDLRVKVRFMRQIGNISEMGEDLWATWHPEAAGGVWIAETTFSHPGKYRADVLAISGDGKRGEQQVYFDVAPAASR